MTKNKNYLSTADIFEGNITDNLTLINTVNMLAAYDIEVALLIVDAGYASMENLSKLTSTNIFFLTRMPQNRKEFKKFVSDNEANLRDGAIFINYKNRTLFWKDVNKCE